MWLAQQGREIRNRRMMAAGGALLAVCAFAMIRWPMLALAIAAAGAALGLLKASTYVRIQPKSLLLALILIEVLPSANLIGESARPFIRYSLLLLFAAPAFAKSLRSGMLLRGGFGLYSIYFGLAAFSVIYSIEPLYSASRVLGSLLLFGAICAVAAEAKDDSDVEDLFRFAWIACGLIVALLAVSLVALPQELSWPPAQFGEGMARFAGMFGSPNQVGEIMLATAASGALYWPSAPGRIRGLIALTLIVSLCFAVLADSRSAFVALAVGFGGASAYRWGWKGALAVCAVLLAGTCATAMLGGDARNYLVRGETSTLTGRTEIWSYVASQIRQSPILGYGFETEGQLFQNRYFPLWGELWNQGPHSSIHSGYLARAAGVGIPGALFWMFLIARPLVSGLRGERSLLDLRYPILIAAIPVLVLNLVESTGGDCRESVGLLLTLVWCMAERSKLLMPDDAVIARATEIEPWQVRRLARGG